MIAGALIAVFWVVIALLGAMGALVFVITIEKGRT